MAKNLTDLHLGTLASGAPFLLPVDLVVHTLAIIGQRGSGKTVAATVIAEEFCEAGLPWVSVDPVGVWWGLRAKPDGSPDGYSPVVFGGAHGDLPLLKDQGRALADAIMERNASCIIDMSGESKTTVRHFVAEFCDRAMELRPDVPRHFFFEESPELVPQRAMGEQQRAKAAVDRLTRLGRNFGYGASLISQRYATIDKDVLTQAENLLSFRVIGKTDRDACADWIEEVVQETDSKKKAAQFMKSLTTLDSGEGWFWSPQWLGRFEKIQIRRRKSFHPGATRTVGQRSAKQVAMSSVDELVEDFKRTLSVKKTNGKTFDLGKKPEQARRTKMLNQYVESEHMADELAEHLAGVSMVEELARLRRELMEKSRECAALRSMLGRAQVAVQPLYDALRGGHNVSGVVGYTGGQVGAATAGARPATIGAVDLSLYEPYRPRLTPAIFRLLENLIKYGGTMPRAALSASIGLPAKGTTFRQYISRLNALQLVEKDGATIRLRPL